MLNRTPSVPIGAVSVMVLAERDVIAHVGRSWRHGTGGSIVTVNVDILRAVSRDRSLAALIERSELVVADGMPLVWAASMAGCPLPERVTGASLVWTLAEAASRDGRSVYLIGGDRGIPETAAERLAERFPGLRIAGTESPPFGFEKNERQIAALAARVRRADPDLVLVGLGFPKQEHLIARLREAVPRAWLLGCGAGIAMAAGQFRRAPDLLQRIGAEWLHRLVLEPRRLARRYLWNDLPFAVLLLAQAWAGRFNQLPPPAPELLPERMLVSRPAGND